MCEDLEAFELRVRVRAKGQRQDVLVTRKFKVKSRGKAPPEYPLYTIAH